MEHGSINFTTIIGIRHFTFYANMSDSGDWVIRNKLFLQRSISTHNKTGARNKLIYLRKSECSKYLMRSIIMYTILRKIDVM